MRLLFKKLNYKDQTAIWIVNAPQSFRPALDAMLEVTEVRDGLAGARAVTFALAFATRKSEVDTFASLIAKAAPGDAVVWVAYPKGTSTKFKCEFNRDNGWDQFGVNGFEPVRMASIDEDWSALRFRRVEFVRSMSRGSAVSKAGQEKLGRQQPGK